MKVVATISELIRAWTDTAATATVSALDRVFAPRTVRLRELADGAFAVDDTQGGMSPLEARFSNDAFGPAALEPVVKGRRLEIVLRSQRFLLKPLELPARAADFLDGIVRAQVDRLTPWTAAEATFGCSPPLPHGDGIVTIVAATTRKTTQIFVDAARALHPRAVVILADTGDQRAAPIKVLEQKARGHLDPARLGRTLRVALLAVAAAAAISSAVASYVASSLADQEAELSRQIAQRRAAIQADAAGVSASPSAALERRKYETPMSVIVLEALSRALPDHTHVTELHVAGRRLQVAGITRDAPSLIPLLEQTGLFSRATFYAPTTRLPTDPGDRFYIEARIETRSPTQ